MNERLLVLIADNDPFEIQVISQELIKSGYDVIAASDARDCLDKFRDHRPSLVIVGSTLPSASGFTLCHRLRSEGEACILLILDQPSQMDVTFGFEIGADQCLQRPYDLTELAARVEMLLHPICDITQPAKERYFGETIVVGDIIVCPRNSEVFVAGRRIDLTRQLMNLICLFASRPNTVVTRNMLANLMFSNDKPVKQTRIIEMVRRLRERIEEDPSAPKYLIGIRMQGGGYKLAC